MELEANVELG